MRTKHHDFIDTGDMVDGQMRPHSVTNIITGVPACGVEGCEKNTLNTFYARIAVFPFSLFFTLKHWSVIINTPATTCNYLNVGSGRYTYPSLDLGLSAERSLVRSNKGVRSVTII